MFLRAHADYLHFHPQCACDCKTIGSHLKYQIRLCISHVTTMTETNRNNECKIYGCIQCLWKLTNEWANFMLAYETELY